MRSGMATPIHSRRPSVPTSLFTHPPRYVIHSARLSGGSGFIARLNLSEKPVVVPRFSSGSQGQTLSSPVL